ncbi:hypothetical protein B9Z55_013807 [Caenorhabditis nigoni]|uniref:CUB-like domain-containing protein n=1 Tax=Caenorhabditis nigoni TaxID=1611254 RepID=A0A2G5U3B8_9PELO|nr:hypothetical protein B9Z55_013807 [Caenorhabditis nigoni]
MKYLLLLLFLPTVSSYFFKLSKAKKCVADSDIGYKGFSQYYTVPMGNDKITDFGNYKINEDNLPWPNNAKIANNSISTGDGPNICYPNEKIDTIAGGVYLIKAAFVDMDVYHAFSEDVIVQATKQYTVIFSKTDKGLTLSDFQTDSNTIFQIYTGLPDGEPDIGDTPYLLYSYNSTMSLDFILIKEEYFFVKNTGSKTLNFTFSEDEVSPSDATFNGTGFVGTPGYPTKAADDDYLDMPIKMIKDDTTDRLLNVKVTTIIPVAPAASFAKAIILDASPGVVTITVAGQTPCSVQATKVETTEYCKLKFPAKTESFKVHAESAAYAIQFEVTEIPPTTVSTTTEASTTTAKDATTTKSCPACTTVAATACPTVTTTVCPAITCPTTIIPSTTTPTIPTTSDPSTTTMGASTSSVASLILITLIYSLF